MANILSSGNPTPDKLFGVTLNSSEQGLPVTVVLGCAPTNQNILWTDGFTSTPDSSGKKGGGGGGGGGKGGGKGDGQYLYSADVIAGLSAGPILGIGDLWTGQSWLGSPTANESYTIASPYTYTPTNASALVNNYGVSPASTYAASYDDYGSPVATPVRNNTAVPMVQLEYGSTLDTGEYSVSPSGTYSFSPVDEGRTVTVSYSYLLTTINQQENDVVPAGLAIQVGGNNQFEADLGVMYGGTGANNGKAFTRVNGTPAVAGTYRASGSAPATYTFAAADTGAQITITYQINNPNAVGQNESTMLDFTLATGASGQQPYSFLSASYPGAAISYPGIATILYEPMDLGVAGEIQENRFEIITPHINGGAYANGTPILDCNPARLMNEVLTNSVWGLGVGAIPFPTAFIDNGAGGTWGGSGTSAQQSVNSSAWNWFASNSFFISPVLDSQDTAASTMSKWLEAGMCAAFVSEGLLKLVPYGDTSQAANGYTWTAPSIYVAALDDTSFVAKDGQDPVTIKRTPWQDAYNTVQVQWDNRSSQYAAEVTQESDQSLIDRFGSRIEDPQDWDFIHTLTAATFAANMRLKHGTYIRNTYEFTLPFNYSFLEPMDLVSLTTSSVWAAGINNTNLGVTNLPVRVTKVVDDPVEGIKIEAEDYPFGAGQPTLFNKGQSQAEVLSSPYASPGTAEVVLFEASARLTGFAGNQIWMGACGTSTNYGSTNVWVSQDNVNYAQVGTITQPAVIGELASTFGSGNDPDTTNVLLVQLVENSAGLASGATTAADNDTMLCYMDGEVISYSAAALTGQNTYTLGTYIRRGQLGTAISSHAAGSLFMRLDGSIIKYTYDPTWQGKTVYFKFQAVNAFGNNPQPLSNLSAVSFTISSTNGSAIDAATGHANTLSYSNGATLQSAQGLSYAGASESIVPNGDFVLGNAEGWFTPEGNGTWGWDKVNGITLISGGNVSVGSQTFAVVPGQKYRISYDVLAGSGSQNVYLRINYAASYSDQITSSNRSGEDDFIGAGSIATSETVYSYDWTCPTGVYYASLAVYEWIGASAPIFVKGVSCVPYGAAAQWGADVTSANTSANTSAVGSVSAGAVSGTILPNGGVDYLNGQNANFPTDTTNLVKTGSFENGSTGNWGRPTVAVTGQPFSKALFTQSRDTEETNNNIPVTPGQRLFVSGYANSQSASSQVNIGLFFPQIPNWIVGAALGGNSGWTYISGWVTVPDGVNFCVPWLQIGYDGDGSQTALYANLYISTAQKGADVTGQNTANNTNNVAGVPASTIAEVVPNGYKLFINSGNRSYSITAV